ncbi:class I histocompatibility antigen, F10 alpha chain-like [Macrotis lagotis]|uniref:class I histocompatibility antigen, F10 alpha chain-like n=1 Tax=Macrotis lagotis TaxID=92651 RepID=UPI003D6904B9
MYRGGMMNWRKGRGSFPSWLLILVLLVLREIKAAYHKHEIKHIAVSTSQTLLDLIVVCLVDDIHWASYHKSSQQFVMKAAWMSEALGKNIIEDIQQSAVKNEEYYQLAIHSLIRNDSQPERNHTLQILLDCDLDGEIQLSSHIKYGLDGEDMLQLDGLEGQWIVLNPIAHSFRFKLEEPFWSEVRKNYIKRYCIEIMQKILWNSSITKNRPPEVYVSRQDFPNGTITLSCTATGFYPQSILLHWEKGTDGAIWGKESSSGTLPNSDDTFYLRISLEIQPGDPGTGYACVVEHSQLESPTLYFVPENSSKGNLWTVALSIVLAAILTISCFVIFTKWKKRKSESSKSHGQIWIRTTANDPVWEDGNAE